MQLWGLAEASAAIVVIASLADRRRQRRADLDKVGFMPWPFITLMAVLATLILTTLALKLGSGA